MYKVNCQKDYAGCENTKFFKLLALTKISKRLEEVQTEFDNL